MKFFSILLISTLFFTLSSGLLVNSHPRQYYQSRQYYQPRQYYQAKNMQKEPIKLDNYIQCQETSVSDYERNQYYLNLYEKEMKIAQDEDYATDDEDIFNVSDRNYYDKYSFKTNWADSWKESNIRPTGWFTLSTNSEK